MLRQGDGMTQKMSFVSHRRQPSNGWSSRGGWRHRVQLGKPGKACPRRDSPEHRELVGGAQPLSRSWWPGWGARQGCGGYLGLWGWGGGTVREGMVLQPLCVTVCHKGLLSLFEHSLKILHLTRSIWGVRWEKPWQQSTLPKSELSRERETSHQHNCCDTHPADAKSGNTARTSVWPCGPLGMAAPPLQQQHELCRLKTGWRRQLVCLWRAPVRLVASRSKEVEVSWSISGPGLTGLPT